MTTTNYSYAQFAPGLTGILDTARNAGRTYGYAGGQTAWVGTISGSSATLAASSDIGPAAGLLIVTVDGGARTAVAVAGGLYTLFSGLADAAHTVLVEFDPGYSNIPYFANSGNILAVTGAAPAAVVATQWVQPFDGSALTATSGLSIAVGGTYVPTGFAGNTGSAASGSSVPSIRVKTSASLMRVVSKSRWVHVSVDGAAPVRYDSVTPTSTTRLRDITLDGALHTYTVWPGFELGYQPNPGVFCVGFNAAIADVGTKRRLEQYGDSITYGQGALSRGAVDTLAVGAALGMAAGTYGVSGNTIADVLARLPAILSAKTIDSVNDVAVLAIGRNDTGGTFTTQRIADYNAIVNALKARYGKVLCRGILPEGSNAWPSENASISGIVTSQADAKVKFINTASWSGISAPSDNVHPDDAGYVTITGYATPAYTTALAVAPAAATATTLTGPTTGTTGSASTSFAVGVSPVGGTISGTVVVTPSDSAGGGTFTPASVSLTTASPTGTFTYTAASSSAKTISVTNSPVGLSNPASLTYTASAVVVPVGPVVGVSAQNLRVVSDNAIDRATLGASTTAGSLSVDNLLVDGKSLVHRATSTTVVYTATWAAAETLAMAAAVFCNCSPTTTIQVQLYDAVTGGTLLLDTAVLQPGALACPAPAISLRGWTPTSSSSAYAYGGGATARVWFAKTAGVKRMVLTLVDTNSLQGYVEASRLVAGTYWSPVANPDYGPTLTWVDLSRSYRTESGDLKTDAGPRYRKLGISLSLMPVADRSALANILRGGTTGSLFFSLYPESSSQFAVERDYQVYGRLTDVAAMTLTNYNAYSTPIEIAET